MKSLKQILLSGFTAISATTLFGQAAWVEPDPINPNDSITIWVDLNKCTFGGAPTLASTTDDLYMWTWSPKEHPVGYSCACLQMRTCIPCMRKPL